MIRNKLRHYFKVQKPSSLAMFDQEVPASTYIPISHFLTDSIFATKQGDIGAVIQVEGISFETKAALELNQLQQQLNFFLLNLGEAMGCYITMHRQSTALSLNGDYPAGFIDAFVKDYHAQFVSYKMFTNSFYITVISRAPILAKSFTLGTSKAKLQFESDMCERVKAFESTLMQLLQSLSIYQPQVLGKKISHEKDTLPEAEVLSFLSRFINGEDAHYTYPYHDIASFVPQKRLFFGANTLCFEGLTQHAHRYGAMLSVKTYPPETHAGYLNDLLQVPFEIITTHSFLSVPKFEALKQIDKQFNRLMSTEDKATSQLAELENAKDAVASHRLKFGHHHHTILILSDDIKSLDEKVATIIKIYQAKNVQVVRETLNLENAFWAQIPGNFKYIRRQALMSSQNFTSFCSLHHDDTGYINQNHLGSALMLAQTQYQTPFYFNLHEKASGRSDDLSKGHAILIGPSNAGKTVIMTTIDAMMKKYHCRSFFIDRNYGCELYVRASGGHYFRLSPGKPTGWNPCQLPDTLENRAFLRDFIRVLSTTDKTSLSANDLQQIHEAVAHNYNLPLHERTLSNLAQFLRLDFSGLDALSRYLKGGDKAYLFDNEADTVNFDAMTVGFDMTHWLNSEKPLEELLPINMYLFHRIDQKLDGQLTGLYCDEGWQFLGDATWIAKLNEYLVTWRKRNAFVFFATQLPDKVAASPLASALIQNTATQLFLANPKAEKKDYVESFKLSEREFEIVKTLNPSERYFLMKQNHESAIVRITFQGCEKYLRVLSGTEESVKRCEVLREKCGDAPDAWLPHFMQETWHEN